MQFNFIDTCPCFGTGQGSREADSSRDLQEDVSSGDIQAFQPHKQQASVSVNTLALFSANCRVTSLLHFHTPPTVFALPLTYPQTKASQCPHCTHAGPTHISKPVSASAHARTSRQITNVPVQTHTLLCDEAPSQDL